MNFVIRYVFLHSIRFDFQTDGVVGIKGVGRNVFIISMMKCFVQESMLFIWRVERIFPEYLIKGVVLISISQVYHPPPPPKRIIIVACLFGNKRYLMTTLDQNWDLRKNIACYTYICITLFSFILEIKFMTF